MPPELPSDGAKGSIEDVEKKLGISFVQTHRRRKSDRLPVQTALAKQQSHVSTAFHYLRALGRCWLLRCAVFHQLNWQQQAFAAYVADQTVFPFYELEYGESLIADSQCVGL